MFRRARGDVRTRLRIEHLEDRAVPASYDPGRVLVTFADTNNDPGHLAELARSPVAAAASRLGFGLYEVDLASGISVESAVQGLSSLPGVLYAQPDYMVMPDAIPNDPQVGSQYAFNSSTTAGAGINASAAWTVTTGTARTIVAVIDTGVDYNHADLARNMWRNPREIAGNNWDDDGNGFVDDIYGANFVANNGNPMDDGGHGTHVAGIIGAAGNNGVGVTGVAWTTQIMALRFMSANSGGYTSDAVRAMDYAIANGAKILNLSWGGGTLYQPLQDAIARARNAGVIVVAAAGNNGSNNDSTTFYPASYIGTYNNMVTVAATDSSDRLATYSNFGANSVTIAAPGTNIHNTLYGGGYGLKSGTSMAAPFISGSLALLWDLHPTWSYQQIIAKMKASVDPLSSLAGKTLTGGRIDLAKLLDYSPPSPPATPPATPPASPPPTTGSDTTGPRVLNSIMGGSKTGTFDRVWVQFSETINLSTFTSGDLVINGPGGGISISSITPVSGTNNSQFLLMFSKAQTTSGAYTLTLGPDVSDLAGNVMDQNQNGTRGETADRFTLSATLAGTVVSPPVTPPASPPSPPVASPPVATTPTTGRANYTGPNSPVAISDSRTTRIDINVMDSFTITDLNVLANLSHGRTWDLSIRIVAPDGRAVTLFNRRGGNGANLTNTVFDDQASTSIATATAPFSGSYKPEQLLSIFNGMNARGLWSIQIFDLAAGVTGAVNSLTLSFAGSSIPASVQATNLSATDLRGASDDVKTAVLAGRGDKIVVPGMQTIAPPGESQDSISSPIRLRI